MEETYALICAVGEATAERIQTILSNWKAECRALKDAIKDLNSNLKRDFKNLSKKVVNVNDFDKFLDSLEFVGYSNHISLTSKYSSIEKRGLTWDDTYDLIIVYIEELIKRNELVFEGFQIWDSFFLDMLYEWHEEKFGYYYEDCDEEAI